MSPNLFNALAGIAGIVAGCIIVVLYMRFFAYRPAKPKKQADENEGHSVWLPPAYLVDDPVTCDHIFFPEYAPVPASERRQAIGQTCRLCGKFNSLEQVLAARRSTERG